MMRYVAEAHQPDKKTHADIAKKSAIISVYNPDLFKPHQNPDKQN